MGGFNKSLAYGVDVLLCLAFLFLLRMIRKYKRNTAEFICMFIIMFFMLGCIIGLSYAISVHKEDEII